MPNREPVWHPYYREMALFSFLFLAGYFNLPGFRK